MAYLYTRYLKERESLQAEEAQESKREDGLVRDQEYFRNLYPLKIRRMKDYVQEEVERLGFQGFLSDEYPDRVRMDQARDRIVRKMQQDSVPEVLVHGEFGRDVVETLLYQEILELRARQ